MFNKRFLGVLGKKKEVDKNLRMIAEKSWNEIWWLRKGTSVSRYLRKLGVKKALEGRLGPLLQLSGLLMWWTRFWIRPLVKRIDLWMLTESQLHLYLWLRTSISSCSVTRVCIYMYSYMGCPVGFLARNFRSWRTEKVTTVDVFPWERGGEAHLLPSAKVLGSQGAASRWTFW